jgi:autotransporter-associated beta strand protein
MDGIGHSSLCSLLLAGTAMCAWTGGTGAPTWEDPGNWSEAHAPGPLEGALFGDTTHTTVRLVSDAELRSILFSLDAPAYQVTLMGVPVMKLTGDGIRNDSAFTQNIVLQPGSPPVPQNGVQPMAVGQSGTPTIRFTNSASASGGTGRVRYTGTGNLSFEDSSTAGNADIDLTGDIGFSGTSTAGSADIALSGGLLHFGGAASAGNANITIRGGAALTMDRTTGGASINIRQGGTADITTDGTGPTTGGAVYIDDGITRFHTAPGATSGRYSFGSLAGGGSLDLGSGTDGPVALVVGSNGASTRYTGTITGRGSLTKTGVGSLVLTGANSSTGGLAVAQGNLYVSPDSLGNGPITIDGKLYISEPGADRSIFSPIGGSGKLILSSGNAITLNAANSYAGGTEIQRGTFAFANPNAFGTGTISIGKLGAIRALPTFHPAAGINVPLAVSGQSIALANAIVLTNSSSVETGSGTTVYDTQSVATINTNANTLTLSGGISGTGDLRVNGGGILILTADATHTGLTALANNTTLRLGNGGTGGSLAGDLDVFGALEINLSRDYTYRGFLSGNGSVLVGGTGLVTFAGDGDFDGLLTIANGARLQLGDGTVGGGTVEGDFTNNGQLIVNLINTNTFSGQVTGTGSIEFKAGKTILTNSNNYTGGTTIDSGATLQLGDGEHGGSVEGDIVDNGLLIANIPGDGTSATQVSGSGAFRLMGGHILTLTGNSSFTGGTTVDAGSTLRLGDGTTDGHIAGNVTNNGALAFNWNSATAFAGLITGSGSVAVTGPGKTTLTANNSYAGQTSISAGSTLQLGQSGTTGMVSGPIAIGGSLIVDRSDNVTYTGALSGAGSFAKNGAGALIYNGDGHLYTGALSVNTGSFMIGDAAHETASLGGSATVAPGAMLLGHGTLGGSLINNGGVRPGGSIGTLHVGGNYTQSAAATLTLDIEPGGSSTLAVGGSASLGGTLALVYAPGTYTARNYDLVTATGGITGTFSTVTGTVPNGTVTQNITYSPNAVRLALASVIVAPQNPTIRSTLPLVIAEGGAWDEDQDFERARDPRAGLWGEARGHWGHTAGDATNERYQTHAWGISGGANFDLSGAVRLGAAVSWNTTDLHVDDISSATIDTLRGSASARIGSGPFTLAARISAARHRVSNAFRISSPTTLASAGFDASSLDAAVRAGWRIDAGGWSIEPRVGASLRGVWQDSYTESGAGAFGVAIDPHSYRSLRSYAGIGVGHTMGGIRLTADTGWTHEFGDIRGTAVATASDGTRFDLASAVPGRDRLTAGAGIEGEILHGVALFANARIDPDIAGASAKSASAGLRIAF